MNIPKGLVVKPRATDYIKGVNSPIEFKAVSTDWIQHLEFFENQSYSYDTNGCVLFTAQESFDAQMDALIANGTIPDSVVSQFTSMGFMDLGRDGLPHFHSSARFLEVLTGNGTNGNAVPEAWDVLRKYGTIPWKDLPYDATVTEAQYFNPIPKNLLDKGVQFLNLIGGKYAIPYHWIRNDAPKNIPAMQAALPQAPLCLGVAVAENWNLVTPSPDPAPSETPQHCVMGYKINGSDTLIDDHYNPYLKVLGAGYPINYVFQGIVNPIFPPPLPTPLPSNPTNPQVSSWLQSISNWIQNILSQIKGRNLNGISMNYDIFKSRTLWSLVFIFLYNGYAAISGQLPADVTVIINALVAVLASYFHVDGVKTATLNGAMAAKNLSPQA